MTKKGAAHAPKGIKKSNVKAPVQPAATLSKAELQRRTPGLSKDAGSFLKDRLGRRVKELRCGQNIAAMQEEASRRGDDFQRQQEEECADEDSFEAEACLNANREVENNRKKFYTELRKVITNADVVIEVLDARDPGACRSQELEKDVLKAGKKLVLLLNKIDLVPKHAVEAWKKHLSRSFPTLCFKAARSGAHRPVHAMTSAENAPEGLLRSTHGVVGADEVMQLLKNYARMNGGQTKAQLSVGIVGYPNTGKSSVINSMKRHSSVQVGGRAGVTKQMQEVPLDSKVTLIDSPGVVFSGDSEDPAVVLRNVVRVESVSDPVGVVEALISKTPREALLEYYGAEHNFSSPQEFLIHVAQSRGKLLKGSALDIPSAARAVIQDWTAGRFRYFVMPPVVSEGSVAAIEAETAEIVHNLAPALDINALLSGGDESMDEGAMSKPAVLGVPVVPGMGDDAMDCEGAGSGMVEVDM
jgi:nuclear GTP-binding protein